MKRHKRTWLVVAMVALGTFGAAGSYSHMSDATPDTKEPNLRNSLDDTGPSRPTVHVLAVSLPSLPPPSASAEPSPQHNPGQDELRNKMQVEVRRALLEAVQQARTTDPARAAAGPAKVDAGGMPDIEMTWEQYRAWTKIAAALAGRDYKAVEQMLPSMKGLFGPSMANAMVDAYIEDYQSFLAVVSDSRCDGYDPQFVWRKTMYMTFALARLNRSSASLDRRATEVRTLCGFAG